jgi:hypothetical protein
MPDLPSARGLDPRVVAGIHVFLLHGVRGISPRMTTEGEALNISCEGRQGSPVGSLSPAGARGAGFRLVAPARLQYHRCPDPAFVEAGMFWRQPSIEEEIAFLESIYGAKNTAKIFDHLYDNLSIIDSKSASLLTFNAIGLAAISIWLGYVPPNQLHFWLDVVFVAFVSSCCLCLLAVFLYWSTKAGGRGRPRPAREVEATLLRKRRFRTWVYRFAWAISGLSVLALLVISIYHGYGTYRKVYGSCDADCMKQFGPENWGNLDFGDSRRVIIVKPDGASVVVE